MRSLWWRAGVMAVLAVVVGCGPPPDWKIDGRITRYTAIKRHQFKPAELSVPAYTPFWLAIDGYDEMTALIVSSDDLNIPRRRIPSHVHTTQWLETDAPVRTRIAVEALQPGRYEFTCECHGKPSTLIIRAIPSVTLP